MATATQTIYRLLKGSIVSVIILFTIVLLINLWVGYATRNEVYNSTHDIPHNKVGLLLGTAKTLVNGQINLYYKYRIDAAVQLFEEGKVDFILVSGDNGSIYYNEPTTIQKDLVARGIPEEKIFLDYAGFRTLDSMVRSKAIFGQTQLTVISQQFHNERAIFIGKYKGIEAVGFNAKDVGVNYGLKIQIRERLARVKMFLDLLLGKQPKFLGEPIEIN